MVQKGAPKIPKRTFEGIKCRRFRNKQRFQRGGGAKDRTYTRCPRIKKASRENGNGQNLKLAPVVRFENLPIIPQVITKGPFRRR